MKTAASILPILLLLLLAGQAGASYWFQVTDISPVTMMPNSEASFTVSVKGMGSQGAYVEMIFLNKSPGIDTSCERLIQYIFPTGTTIYNCTVKSADIPPGNYSFVVDVVAAGAPSGRKTAYVNVVAAENGAVIKPRMIEGNQTASENRSLSSNESVEPEFYKEDQGTSASEPRRTPAPGVVPAILALLLIMRRMRR